MMQKVEFFKKQKKKIKKGLLGLLFLMIGGFLHFHTLVSHKSNLFFSKSQKKMTPAFFEMSF